MQSNFLSETLNLTEQENICLVRLQSNDDFKIFRGICERLLHVKGFNLLAYTDSDEIEHRRGQGAYHFFKEQEDLINNAFERAGKFKKNDREEK